MFSIVHTLRACRSIGLAEKFASLCVANPLNVPKGILNPHRLSQVRIKCQYSTEPDPNKDPLADCDAIYPLNKVLIEELTGNDPKEIKKLRILQMELAVKSVQNPSIMPAKLRLDHWRTLLSLSRTAQMKYLLTVKKKESRYVEKKVDESVDDPAEYDFKDYEHHLFDHRLFRNALFPMIHPNCMGNAMNSNLLNALQFNSTLVMDFGFEDIMTDKEIKNLCQQIGACINVNRFSRNPYNMVFSNLKRDSKTSDILWAAIPNIFDEDMPLITTESCYTQLYPKKKLVYLTPHCREMVHYNPDDVYIIGAMVDKTNPGPHSLIKAKSQGIRLGSFPIDKYLIWKKGTKSLTLNQVLLIMLKMAETGEWTKAFQAVPKRKISDVMSYTGFSKKPRTFEF